ncbi:MAG: hypothetical protein JXR88_05640 [Clostridia bacterium]|nr:hypothetical protein [Clostridia bacterium]
MEINKEAIEYIDGKLKDLVDEKVLNPKHERIIRLRYGVGCEPSDFKTMLKICRLKPKEMKDELVKAEKRVFNILKKNL